MEYDTICLSGGGINGLGFLGVLDYLTTHKHIDINKINNFAGTSIGSFICFILALGYSIHELGEFALNFDFSKIESEININNLLSNCGLNTGDKVICFLKFFVEKKLNMDDITFAQLYEYNQRKIIIIGTNYTIGQEEVFSYDNTPDMSIITAIRISISLPYIFTPVLYNSCYYMDGALVNNFPIKYCNKNTTIGIHINNIMRDDNINLIDITSRIIDMAIKTITIKDYCDTDLDNIIIIDSDSSQSANFGMNYETKLKIINNGQLAAKKHADKHIKSICSSILNGIINKIQINNKYTDTATQTDQNDINL